MVSEGMKRVIDLVKQFSDSEFTVEYLREGLDQLGDMVKLPKDVKCETVDAGEVPAVWISTPDVLNEQAILYLHGGGYIA